MTKRRYAGVEETRQQLPALLDEARAGRPVVITKHGKPFAAIVPLESLPEAGSLRTGNELVTAQYREALTRSAGWQVMPLDVEVAVEAARIRAAYRLRLPDAIEVATAIRAGAAALVTHDRALRRVRGLRIVGPE
jgi:prevent-host-death family protein